MNHRISTFSMGLIALTATALIVASCSAPAVMPQAPSTNIPNPVSLAFPTLYYEGSQGHSDGDLSLSLEFTTPLMTVTGGRLEPRPPLVPGSIEQAKVAYARRILCRKQLPVERSYVAQLINIVMDFDSAFITSTTITPSINLRELDFKVLNNLEDPTGKAPLISLCASGADIIDEANRAKRWDNLIQFSIQISEIAQRDSSKDDDEANIWRELWSRVEGNYNEDYFVPNECHAKSADLPFVIGRPYWWFVMSFNNHDQYKDQYKPAEPAGNDSFRAALHHRYTYLESLTTVTDTKHVKPDGSPYPKNQPGIWACVVAYDGDETNEAIYFDYQPCWWTGIPIVRDFRATFDGNSSLQCHVDLSFTVNGPISGTNQYRSTAQGLLDPQKPYEYVDFTTFWIKAYGLPETSVDSVAHLSLNNGSILGASNQFGVSIQNTKSITWGLNFEQITSTTSITSEVYDWWWRPDDLAHAYMPNPDRSPSTKTSVIIYPRGIFYIGFDPVRNLTGANVTLDEIIVDPCAGNGGTKCSS